MSSWRGRPAAPIADAAAVLWEAAPVIRLGDVIMILDLHRQGLSVSAIARRPKLVTPPCQQGHVTV